MNELARRDLSSVARFFPVVFFALVIVCTTSNANAEPPIHNTVCCHCQDVILIRGGGGYWPGAQAMADHFSHYGYNPTIIHGWEYAIIARKIARATIEGRRSGDVVIVGYSSGADCACALARQLEKYGLRVQTMVLIESTLGLSVPANVDLCVNFYASRMLDMIPVFRGVPVEAEGTDTVLCNIDVKNLPEFADLIKQSHFIIGSTAMIRDMAVQVVLSHQPGVVAVPIKAASGTVPQRTAQR